jgi:hypothetical protein
VEDQDDDHGGSSSLVMDLQSCIANVRVSDWGFVGSGSFTVCRSAAWKAKMVTSAWWVHADQVSPRLPDIVLWLVAGSWLMTLTCAPAW